MTGVLQNYSRKNRFQIDMVKIDFEVTQYEMEADKVPELGAYIRVCTNLIFFFVFLQETTENLNKY